VHAGRTIAAMTDIDEAAAAQSKRWDWTWNNWGMRLVYCIAAGTAVNLATGIYALGAVITVALFVLTSVIIFVAHRR